jgi:hypothetical protein
VSKKTSMAGKELVINEIMKAFLKVNNKTEAFANFKDDHIRRWQQFERDS